MLLELPEDLLALILSHLSGRDVNQVKLVCKKLHNLIPKSYQLFGLSNLHEVRFIQQNLRWNRGYKLLFFPKLPHFIQIIQEEFMSCSFIYSSKAKILRLKQHLKLCNASNNNNLTSNEMVSTPSPCNNNNNNKSGGSLKRGLLGLFKRDKEEDESKELLSDSQLNVLFPDHLYLSYLKNLEELFRTFQRFIANYQQLNKWRNNLSKPSQTPTISEKNPQDDGVRSSEKQKEEVHENEWKFQSYEDPLKKLDEIKKGTKADISLEQLDEYYKSQFRIRTFSVKNSFCISHAWLKCWMALYQNYLQFGQYYHELQLRTVIEKLVFNNPKVMLGKKNISIVDFFLTFFIYRN